MTWQYMVVAAMSGVWVATALASISYIRESRRQIRVLTEEFEARRWETVRMPDGQYVKRLKPGYEE